MEIVYKSNFKRQFLNIVDYIKQDKSSASKKFSNELEKRIYSLIDNPFSCRKSIYFDDENIRDLIYKGYTINYRVNLDKQIIEILSIFNKNRPNLQD